MSRDRRVQYTKMIIKKSLYKLMEKKPLAKITVKELCEEADINRATFYRYYRDVLDLAETIEKELVEESFSRVQNDEMPQGVRVLTIIKENRILYRELFRTEMGTSFLGELLENQKKESEKLMKENGTYDKYSFPYAFQYTVSGYIGMIRKWVDEGCRESPEEFNRIMNKVTGGCGLMA